MPQPGLCPQPSRAGWQQDGSGAGCQAAGRRSQEGCLLMRLWGFRCWCGAVEDAELCCWCSRLRAGLASLIGSKWLCTRNKQLARSHAKPCCPRMLPSCLTLLAGAPGWASSTRSPDARDSSSVVQRQVQLLFLPDSRCFSV